MKSRVLIPAIRLTTSIYLILNSIKNSSILQLRKYHDPRSSKKKKNLGLKLPKNCNQAKKFPRISTTVMHRGRITTIIHLSWLATTTIEIIPWIPQKQRNGRTLSRQEEKGRNRHVNKCWGFPWIDGIPVTGRCRILEVAIQDFQCEKICLCNRWKIHNLLVSKVKSMKNIHVCI